MSKFIKKLFKKSSEMAFLQEFQALKTAESQTIKRFEFEKEAFFPCLTDNTASTQFDRHYVYHPAWAARIIKQINPKKHIDISSTLHFCSVLSAFIPVDFYDYRPANLILNNLESKAGDLMHLPFADSSVECISCMHTIEHIGLGRYGDPLDYDGDIKAINELMRVLMPKGNILFVTPVGAKDTICFNAHRIYTKTQVLQLFKGIELKEFTLIPEDENDGGLIINPDESLLEKQFYGCGCFWFTKP